MSLASEFQESLDLFFQEEYESPSHLTNSRGSVETVAGAAFLGKPAQSACLSRAPAEKGT